MVKLVGRQLNNNYLSFNTKVFELNLNHHLIADEKDINCTLIKINNKNRGITLVNAVASALKLHF